MKNSKVVAEPHYPPISIKDALGSPDKQPASVNGRITEIRQIETKTGEPMCVCVIENGGDELEAIVFPDVYAKYSRHIEKDGIADFCGGLSRKVGMVSMIVTEVKPVVLDNGDEIEIEIEWTPLLSIEELQEHKHFKESGIYLWIQNDVITYVGEARCYQDRFTEHLQCMVDGRYSLWRFLNRTEDPYQEIHDNNGVPGINRDRTTWSSAWNFEEKRWSLSKVIDPDRIRDVLETIGGMRFALGVFPRLPGNTNLRRDIEGGLIQKICEYYKLPTGRYTTAIGKISKCPVDKYRLIHGGEGGCKVSALLAKAIPSGIIG